MDTASRFASELQGYVEYGRIVLDLCDLTDVDEGALAVLLGFARRRLDYNYHSVLVVVNPSPTIRDSLVRHNLHLAMKVEGHHDSYKGSQAFVRDRRDREDEEDRSSLDQPPYVSPEVPESARPKQKLMVTLPCHLSQETVRQVSSAIPLRPIEEYGEIVLDGSSVESSDDDGRSALKALCLWLQTEGVLLTIENLDGWEEPRILRWNRTSRQNPLQGTDLTPKNDPPDRPRRKKEKRPKVPSPPPEPAKPGEPMSRQERGRLGGEETAKRHGQEFYEQIGRMGAERMIELLERGRRAEAGDKDVRAEGNPDENDQLEVQPSEPQDPADLSSSPRLTWEVREDHSGNRVTLLVAGEIDMYTAPLLKQLIVEHIEKQVIEIDFTNVTFTDSSGFGTLLVAVNRRRSRPLDRIRVLNPNRSISSMLQQTRLDTLIEVVEPGKKERESGSE